jgi:hypothetical protein
MVARLILKAAVEYVIDEIAEQLGKLAMAEAIQAAIETMSNLTVNEGQDSAFEIHVKPAFLQINPDPEKCFPEKVYWTIPGDTLEFMGGIVSEGVAIVEEALVAVKAAIEAVDAATDIFL